ncbi:MAG: hypothetical protein WED10_13520 [Brumimicrobium sp.]
MNITKENYEAFLLDLSEGNLSDELKNELTNFLNENPDLDAEIIDGFVELKTNVNTTMDQSALTYEKINNSNRKHFFTAYFEGDLNQDEEKMVFDFIATNKTLKNEFEQFRKAKLIPSTEEFKHKNSLYAIADRKTNRVLFWIPRIAAAFVILFFGMKFLIQNDSSKKALYSKSKLDTEKTTSFDIDSVNFIKIKDNNTPLTNSGDNINKTSTLKDHDKHLSSVSKKETDHSFDDEEKNKKNDSLNSDKLFEVPINIDISNTASIDTSTIRESPKRNKQHTNKPIRLKDYLVLKGKKVDVIDSSGRPDLIGILNKGSKSLTGEEIIAQRNTQESKKTVFQLGGLRIERSTGN